MQTASGAPHRGRRKIRVPSIPVVRFATTERWRHRWDETFETYRGNYILYCRPVFRRPDVVVAAFLSVEELTKDGITVTVVNVDTEAPGGVPRSYYYRGFLFPLDEFLYFVGEETTARYEIISILCEPAVSAVPDLLPGTLLAIGVRGTVRRAASTRLVLSYLGKEPVDPSALVGEKLGLFKDWLIPPEILEIVDADT